MVKYLSVLYQHRVIPNYSLEITGNFALQNLSVWLKATTLSENTAFLYLWTIMCGLENQASCCCY